MPRRSRAALLADLSISPEVGWYLKARGIPLPDCPPKFKTPEPRDLPGARFDPERVDRVLAAFKVLRHTQGKWAGKPLIPDPWQVAYILAPVYGWVRQNEDGDWVRIFRTEYVEIPRKNGKLLNVTTPMLTVGGWKTMGTVAVDDQVFAPDGTPTRVTFVSDTQTETTYRITFADGAALIAGARHQWQVNDRMRERSRVATTEEIARTCHTGSRGDRRYTVDVPEALQLPNRELPIDPWLLGYWLGNGSRGYGHLTVGGWAGEDDLPTVLAQLDRAGETVRPHTSNGPHNTRVTVRGLIARLRALGVDQDKHIPEAYLLASQHQRRALLAGLLDSDGTASHGAAVPRVELGLSDKQLALDGLLLARSLGFKATMHERTTASGRTGYRVAFTASAEVSPFTLARKTAQLERPPVIKRQRSRTNAIVSCVEVPPVPMRCIEVEHPSHCYLAGNALTPTHNTTIAGGQAMYLTGADGEQGAQVYAVAAAKDQARYCFDPVKALAERAPGLASHMKVTQYRIVHKSSASYFAVVSSVADLMHGANIHGAVIDELHVHKTRDLVDAVESGTGARNQPLVVVITTADDSRQGTIYAERRTYVEQLAAGVITDPSFYGVVWAAEDDDDSMAETTWRKANPGFGVSPTREFLAAEAQKAANSPANLARFQRLHLGIRTKQQTRYLDLAVWDRNASLIDEAKLVGRACVGGLDLAATSDLTALAWDFPDGEGGHDVIWRHWAPEGALAALNRRTAGQAEVWVRNGWLTLTPGDVVDYDYIRAQVGRDMDAFAVAEIGYDPWNSSQIVNDLTADGAPMVTIRQGYASMSSPTKELLRLLLEGTAAAPRYRHGGNPLVRWQVDHFAVEMDAAGNVKPSKNKSSEKIDGLVAGVMALDRGMRGGTSQSIYEDADFEVG